MLSLIQKIKKYPIFQPIALLKTGTFFRPTGQEKNYPTVMQLPITYHCNSKCVMCNIWQMDWSGEWPVEEFEKRMADPLFSEIKAVGINGGEPTLVKNLDKYAEAILRLSKIKHLNIISHGFNQKQLFPFLETTYAKCKEAGVHFSVIISLDGYDSVHNTVRGLKVFPIVAKTIKEIQDNPQKYCDEFEAACTVVQQNVEHLSELDAYAMKNNIRIKYRLGIENKRIESDKLMPQFSLDYNHDTQSAKEFFHSRMFVNKHFYEKFKYWSIWQWMGKPSGQRKRRMGCDYQDRGVTVDSRGELYYCAVESERIGSLRKVAGEEAFFNQENLDYRRSIIDNRCNECIHDYRGKAHFSDILVFAKDYLYHKFYPYLYKLKLGMRFF